MRPAVAAAVLLLAGCTQVQPPEVGFRGVTVRGDSLRVALVLFNPNRFSVEVAAVDYRLRADEKVIGSGSRAARFRCAGRDSTRVEFPLALDYGAAMAAVLKGIKDTVRFRVEGDYRLKTGFGSHAGRFEAAREVNLLAALQAVLEEMFGRGR